jgi:hypothetical protein
VNGGSLLVIFCLLVGWWCMRSGGGRGRTGVAGHAHGGARATIATHEAGHVVGARAVGGRVLSARMTDHGGRVEWDMTSRSLVDEVTSNVAFLRAGEYAAGTRSGCSGDRSSVKQQLRRLPSGQRGVVLRAGEQRARQIVRSRSGEIARVADQLNQKGRL